MVLLGALGLIIGADGVLSTTSGAKAPRQVQGSRSAMEIKYRSARRLLDKANVASAAKHHGEAGKLLDQALHLLGDDYAGPEVDDDTGMKLVAAMAETKKGHIDIAANLKRRVLESRLELFRARHLCH